MEGSFISDSFTNTGIENNEDLKIEVEICRRYLTDFGSVPISYGPAPAWFLRMLSFRALDHLILGGFDAFSNGHLNEAMQGTHLTKLSTHGDLDTDDFASLCKILAPHLKCLTVRGTKNDCVDSITYSYE
jgi:hypothetical protein